MAPCLHTRCSSHLWVSEVLRGHMEQSETLLGHAIQHLIGKACATALLWDAPYAPQALDHLSSNHSANNCHGHTFIKQSMSHSHLYLVY